MEAGAQWSLVWLTVLLFVGLLVTIQFHNREFFDGSPVLHSRGSAPFMYC